MVRMFREQDTESDKLAGVGESLVSDFRQGHGQTLEDQVLSAARPSLSSVVNTLDEAGTRSGGVFDSAEGISSRQLERQGQTLTDREAASLKRRQGLARALGGVDAKARALEGIEQRSDIARTSAASLRGIVENSAHRGQSALSSIESEREAKFIRDKAKQDAAKKAGLGQIAGLALTAATGGVAGLALGAAGAVI